MPKVPDTRIHIPVIARKEAEIVRKMVRGHSFDGGKCMNLYEINQQILDCVDLDTGEIIDAEMLAKLEIDFDQKVENIGCWIKNLRAEAKAIKEETNSLKERQKACERKAESLKKYLDGALDGAPFKSPKLSISYRKSTSVDVPDVSKLPKKYHVIAEPTANKTEIKAAILAGEKVRGAELVEKQNIQIK